jgi:hypothetical protein
MAPEMAFQMIPIGELQHEHTHHQVVDPFPALPVSSECRGMGGDFGEIGLSGN